MAWFTSTTRSRHDVRVSEPNGLVPLANSVTNSAATSATTSSVGDPQLGEPAGRGGCWRAGRVADWRPCSASPHHLPQLLWCRLAAPCRLPAHPRLTAPVADATPITPGGGGGEFGRRWAQRCPAAGRPGRAAHGPRPDPVPAAAPASGAHRPPAHGPGLPQPQRRRASPGHPAPARVVDRFRPHHTPGSAPTTTSLAPWAPPCWPPRPTRSLPSSATAATGPWPWPTPSGWRICWASTASSVPSPAPPARLQPRR
jgi:hypothetical protein